jgi:copper chaperone CopZ
MTLSSGRGPGQATVRLALTGMHCGSCAALIKEILSDQPGVTAAVVGLEESQALVTFDPARVTVERLCSSVAEVGYSASLVE